MRTDQTVVQAKRFGVFNCRVNQTLGDAARLMVEEDISAVVILDPEGYLAGILSRTDLLRALVKLEDWEDHPIGEFMSRDVVTVAQQTNLVHVAELLLKEHIHRVVVVKEEGGKKRPLSVVSAADLVYHMVKG